MPFNIWTCCSLEYTDIFSLHSTMQTLLSLRRKYFNKVSVIFLWQKAFFHIILSYKTKLINQLRTNSKVLKVRDATQFSKTTRRHSSVKYELINMTKHASEVYCLVLKTMAQLIILSRATKVSGLGNILA